VDDPTGCSRSNGADIIFVLDGSGSIGASNFLLIKNFVKEVVSSFDVGPGENQTRIGVIQYSHWVRTEFNLNAYQTKAQINSAIDNITYNDGSTATHLGLDEMTSRGFTLVNGARNRSNGLYHIFLSGFKMFKMLLL